MAEPKTVTLMLECRSCGGTGLYRGMAEREGVGAVCHTCSGTGAEFLTVRLFEKQKRRDDVEIVVQASGYGVSARFARASGFPHVTYEAFLSGEQPRRISDGEVFTWPEVTKDKTQS